MEYVSSMDEEPLPSKSLGRRRLNVRGNSPTSQNDLCALHDEQISLEKRLKSEPSVNSSSREERLAAIRLRFQNAQREPEPVETETAHEPPSLTSFDCTVSLNIPGPVSDISDFSRQSSICFETRAERIAALTKKFDDERLREAEIKEETPSLSILERTKTLNISSRMPETSAFSQKSWSAFGTHAERVAALMKKFEGERLREEELETKASSPLARHYTY